MTILYLADPGDGTTGDSVALFAMHSMYLVVNSVGATSGDFIGVLNIKTPTL